MINTLKKKYPHYIRHSNNIGCNTNYDETRPGMVCSLIYAAEWRMEFLVFQNVLDRTINLADKWKLYSFHQIKYVLSMKRIFYKSHSLLCCLALFFGTNQGSFINSQNFSFNKIQQWYDSISPLWLKHDLLETINLFSD